MQVDLADLARNSWLMDLAHRLATPADTAAIAALMERAIAELQRPFLDAEQIAASRLSMGLDTQLIADGTYFAISWVSSPMLSRLAAICSALRNGRCSSAIARSISAAIASVSAAAARR